ncbi:MAG: radical SAM family heme chaperone HemW, partial [Oscillospiraceae bacterium]|nr:radical SAM family heme chaperone HemW [Oscillospiraceae bacterium]
VLIDSEVTVEVNPATIGFQDLQRMRKAGINRLSIGIQSSNDGTLKSLGRKHSFSDAEQVVSEARDAGFDNISVDLIYGLPSQTKDEWADTLARTAALQPEHFSCYGLRIEEGTPLYLYRDSPFIPDDDTQADMYLYTVDALNRYGYHQYEISNFALRDRESRHNLKYWNGDDYLGFGAAAHSFIGGQRFNYLPDVRKYTDGILTGSSVVDLSEYISDFEKGCEYLMLGLRTNKGVCASEYYNIYPCSFELVEELLSSYEKEGWVARKGERWSFTPRGFLISNVLIGNILEANTRQRSLMGTPWKSGGELDDSQLSLFPPQPDDTPLFNGIT